MLIETTAPAKKTVHGFVVQTNPDPRFAKELTLRDGTLVRLGSTPATQIGEYLAALGEHDVAVAFVSGAGHEEVPEALREIRKHDALERTRVFLLGEGSRNLAAGGIGDFDVEAVLDDGTLTGAGVTSAVEQGVRAFRALGTNPLIPKFYLDTTFNEIFDWFETTRWDWSEMSKLSAKDIDTSLIDQDILDILKESAIIEFGTLPGAHNFLREWHDEYSFSSWTLSWGAEEARHSLVQCRYLQTIGIEMPAKHAMYKREPYPMGQNRAGTLMMNIISEARAAEYYKTMAARTREPVLRRIWTLLGRDEARHARAFYVFCKEACELSKENLVAALQMAYVWLADRTDGVRHPAGHFYPHSTSTAGIRQVEAIFAGVTDASDINVFAMISKLVGDEVRSVRELKSQLRALV